MAGWSTCGSQCAARALPRLLEMEEAPEASYSARRSFRYWQYFFRIAHLVPPPTTPRCYVGRSASGASSSTAKTLRRRSVKSGPASRRFGNFLLRASPFHLSCATMRAGSHQPSTLTSHRLVRQLPLLMARLATDLLTKNPDHQSTMSIARPERMILVFSSPPRTTHLLA